MSVEASAASLFGPEDSSSDPFATLGTSSDTTSTPDQTADGLFGSQDDSAPSDFLQKDAHDTTSHGPSVHQPTNTQYGNGYTWQQENDPYGPQSSSTGASNYNAQGQYDGYGQWHAQEQPAQPATTYDPYTPQQSSYAPSNVTSSYDYAQPTQITSSASNPYTPPAAASQSQYSIPASYTNTSYTPASQYNTGSYYLQQSTYSQATVSPYVQPKIPKAPAAPLPLDRPKVSNAYDPPFPITKPARRAVSRPNITQATYSSPMSPPPPPPPPPPRAPSLPPPPPRAPSAPHGPPPPPRTSSASLPPPPPPRVPSTSLPPPPPRAPSVSAVPPPHRPLSVSAYSPQTPSQSYYSPQTSAYSANDVSSSVSGSGYANFNSGTSTRSTDYSSSHSAETTISIGPHTVDGLPESVPIDDPEGGGALYEPFATTSTLQNSRGHHPAPSTSPEQVPPVPRSSGSVDSAPRRLSPSPPVSSFSNSGSASHFPRVTSPLAHNVTSDNAYESASQTHAVSSSVNASSGEPYAPTGTAGTHPYSPPSKSSRVSSPANDSYAPPRTLISPSTSLGNIDASLGDPPKGDSPTAVYSPSLPSAGSTFSSASDRSLNDQQPPLINPPINGHRAGALHTPFSTSTQSHAAADPYAPKHPPPPVAIGSSRSRSMSNGSMLSASSERSNDPYAPALHSRIQSSDSDLGNGRYVSRYDYPNNEAPNYPSLAAPQEIVMKTHTPYAPSPSLLGANDPLGRTSVRVPVISFGFGGKMVTCFHGAATLSTGFDVALSSKNSTGVNIKVLKDVVPQSALDSSTAPFPGPLFQDPGTPSTSLVRIGASAHTKAKKTKLVQYLSTRADEISQAIGYLHSGSKESHEAEGKLVLVKLLKVLIEHDGRLSGTPQIDSAVRNALVSSSNRQSEDGTLNSGFVSVSDLHASDSSFSSFSGATLTNETPISVSTLRPSSLEKIQAFLVKGERRQAYHFALDEKLWAHAMVIASGIDKDAWREVVKEFLRTELGPTSDPNRTTSGNDLAPVNGHEALRVAYSLLSGQGPAAVQELVPQNLLARAALRPPAPTVPHMTPMTPNFAAPPPANNVPAASLAQWPQTLAMMISSPLTADVSSAITALGDQLLANQWVEAAHACYLLSPQSSLWGGIAHPAARIILLGSRSPQVSPTFARDPDSIILSEIAEFALSLATPTKGQEPFHGLPHLQVYKLIRAMYLAELGEVSLAHRYCEAITASLGRGSPYFTAAFVDQLKILSDRIMGVSFSDKSGSWTLGKPSFDSISGRLEGLFTKLVTGDSESPTPPESEQAKADEKTFAGTFSHYSTISSATTSTSPSPQPSLSNIAPPRRTGSAMSTSSYVAAKEILNSYSPYSPPSHSASVPSFGQAFGQTGQNSAVQDPVTPRPDSESANQKDTAQEVAWWGSSASNQTPTATTFMKVDQQVAASSSDGFISFMDNSPFSITPEPSSRPSVQHSPVDDEEEDLGFGNSKPKPKKEDTEEVEEEKIKEWKASAAPEPVRPEAKPVQKSSGKSWFSKWWSGDGTVTKASLGEAENSFYYDKELKKWVNKKAGAEEASKPTPPPPPPSRPQTASPNMAGMTTPPSRSGSGPPPARPASAVDLNSSPPHNKNVMRIKSDLAPMPESAPSTPTGSRLAPSAPSPGRPRSQASKRNVRSRYVAIE